MHQRSLDCTFVVSLLQGEWYRNQCIILHRQPVRKRPPQPIEGSYAPMVTEAERNLDWNRSAVQLRNQVRAWGSQEALARIDGKVYLVRRARVVPISSPAQPGTVLERSDERLLVQAGQDALLIEDFREA